MKVDLKHQGLDGPFYTFEFLKSDAETNERVDQSFLRGHRPMLLNGWFYVPSVGTEPNPLTYRLSVRRSSVWELVVWALKRAWYHLLNYGRQRG